MRWSSGRAWGDVACAARLVRDGLRVVVLEKCPHVGGTSYMFRRKGYAFPMGPLAFSFPQKVNTLLAEAGVKKEIEFRRNHFELLAPGLDVVYSRSLRALGEDLTGDFPGEKSGIEAFFREIEGIIRLTKDIEEWHPDFFAGARKIAARRGRDPDLLGKIERVRRLSETRSKNVLEGSDLRRPFEEPPRLPRDGRTRDVHDQPGLYVEHHVRSWDLVAYLWDPPLGRRADGGLQGPGRGSPLYPHPPRASC